MLRRLWSWLREEDSRERYPNGDLVNRTPFPGGWIDGLPLWLQRVRLLLVGFSLLILLLISWLAPDSVEQAVESLNKLLRG